MNVFHDQKKIFQFFSSENEIENGLKYFNLFNKIFIIPFSDNNYFFYNGIDKFHHVIKIKSKIFVAK